MMVSHKSRLRSMQRAPHIGTRNRIAAVGAKLLLIFLDPMISSPNVKIRATIDFGNS